MSRWPKKAQMLKLNTCQPKQNTAKRRWVLLTTNLVKSSPVYSSVPYIAGTHQMVRCPLTKKLSIIQKSLAHENQGLYSLVRTWAVLTKPIIYEERSKNKTYFIFLSWYSLARSDFTCLYRATICYNHNTMSTFNLATKGTLSLAPRCFSFSNVYSV